MDISQENKNIIIEDSARSYPNESCGLLVNINGNIVATPCKNTSLTPEKSFIIDSEQIHKYGLENIEGYYHSHKNNTEFTLADIAFSEKLNKYCVLYIVDSKELKIYKPNGFLIPYVGRPMFPGFLDCVSLFQDFYKRELNIIMRDDVIHPLRYNHKIWTEQKQELIKIYGQINVLEDYLLNNDFTKVNNTQKYDILLFQMPNLWSPSHLGIYLDDNKILHHFFEYSNIDSYNNAFKRTTVGIYRHKSLI